MTELAGEIADGVIFNSINSRDWLAGPGREALAAGARRGGRRPDVGVLRVCGIDEDRAAAYDLARPGLAFYFTVPYFADQLRHGGFEEELAAGSAAAAAGDWEGQVAAVSDRLVDAMAIAGTPDGGAGQARGLRRVRGLDRAGGIGRAPTAGRAYADPPHHRHVRHGRPGRAVSLRKGYADTPDGQVHYRERPGDGTPIVLLHQTASSSVMWERVMRRYPPGRRLLALDTPGFGLSDAPPACPPEGLAYYARRVAGALDALAHRARGVRRASHRRDDRRRARGGRPRARRAARAARPRRARRPSRRARVPRLRSTHWQPDARGDFVADTLLPRMHLSVTRDDGEHMRMELAAYLQAGPRLLVGLRRRLHLRRAGATADSAGTSTQFPRASSTTAKGRCRRPIRPAALRARG